MRHDTLGWLRSAIWAIFLLIAATYSQGQGTPYTGVALGQNQSGTVQIVPMATIQVCAYSATNSCPTPLVGALFGSKTLAPASAMSNPFFADSSGNFTFYAAPNFYTCLVSGPFGSGIGSYSFPCPTPPDSSIFRDGVGFANFGALYFDGTKVNATPAAPSSGVWMLCANSGGAPAFNCPTGAVTWSSNAPPTQDLNLDMGTRFTTFNFSGANSGFTQNYGNAASSTFGVAFNFANKVFDPAFSIVGASTLNGVTDLFKINSQSPLVAPMRVRSNNGVNDVTRFFIDSVGQIRIGGDASNANTAGIVISNSITGNIWTDAGGFKHNVANVTINAGVRGEVLLTWGTAFPDTVYTAICSVEDSSSPAAAQSLVGERIRTHTGAQVGYIVNNPTAGNINAVIDCVGIHR